MARYGAIPPPVKASFYPILPSDRPDPMRAERGFKSGCTAELAEDASTNIRTKPEGSRRGRNPKNRLPHSSPLALPSSRQAPQQAAERGDAAAQQGSLMLKAPLRTSPERGLEMRLATTYSPTDYSAVPSALWDLTTVFGMGTGVTPTLKPPATSIFGLGEDGLDAPGTACARCPANTSVELTSRWTEGKRRSSLTGN